VARSLTPNVYSAPPDGPVDTVDRTPISAAVDIRGDVVAAIADRSADRDLVVGASERSPLGRLLRGTVPERPATRTAAPLLVVERDAGPG